MSMKIGIILCGYNQEEWIARCLAPWLSFRDENKGKVFISACSLPFEEYKDLTDKKDGTQDYLLFLERNNRIDKVFTEPEYIKETAARQLCLDYLLEKDVDAIFLVDSDELFTRDQISDILKFVNKDKFIAWYKLSYKNFFKNTNTYFAEPFTPPRIFRTKIGKNIKIHKFIDDNHICYKQINNEIIHPNQLAHATVHKEVAWINHYSWLDCTASYKKVEYHKNHFADGLCSYVNTNEGLDFNKEYYQKRGIPIPMLIVE